MTLGEVEDARTYKKCGSHFTTPNARTYNQYIFVSFVRFVVPNIFTTKDTKKHEKIVPRQFCMPPILARSGFFWGIVAFVYFVYFVVKNTAEKVNAVAAFSYLVGIDYKKSLCKF